MVLRALSVCTKFALEAKLRMGRSKGKYPGGFNCLQMGYWNVRSLVEADGDITTGMSRPGGRPLVVDHKEFLVREL